MSPGDGAHLLKGKDGDIRVTERLPVNHLRIGANRSFKPFYVGRIDKRHLNPNSRKRVVELIVGSSVQAAARDDVVSRLGQRQDRHRLGSVTGAGGKGSHTPLESRHPLLEHISRRIHNTGIDIAKLL